MKMVLCLNIEKDGSNRTFMERKTGSHLVYDIVIDHDVQVDSHPLKVFGRTHLMPTFIIWLSHSVLYIHVVQ